VLFRSICLWILMDLKNRSMLVPGKSGVDVEGFIRGDELSTPKSLLPKPLQEHTSRRVVYSDLDRNGHMNNARYLDWTQDLLPSDHHQDHPIKELTMCYINEALEGQNLDLNWELDDGGSLHVDIHRCKKGSEDYDRIFAAKVTYE
jgi:medium-chain acyl-[acyl-carrier-protein] hydrolase